MTTLDVLRLPLGGSRLIEASAGTGKTWTIAALYLRLVLGHHGEVESSLGALLPGDILVMTFTRAATRELSDRIRAKLVEAARWFRADDVHDVQAVAPDPFLADLRAAYPAGPAREQAAFRLAMAAESMDDAAIHTIDAWCQRMLREHAFDSGQLFDETLESDENVWLDQAVRDYWRREIYPLRPVDVARVLAVWPGLPACAADVRAWLARWARKPQEETPVQPFGLRDLLGQQTEHMHVLKAGWVERTQSMRVWLLERLQAKTNPFNGVKLRMDTVSAVLMALERWALDEAVDRPDFSPEGARQKGREDRLRPQNLLAALKKGQSVDLPPVFAAYDTLLNALAREPDLQAQLALHAAKGVAERIAELKRQQGCFGFADLLERLNHALLGPQGERLRQRIVTQFPAALIDEFQDTSKRQMQLFEGLYRPASNDPKVALLLIGDPKQSIYGFRGADIYSYLQARQATAPRHHALGVNHRSATALVQAVNQLFERAERRNPGGAFALVDRQGRPGLPFESVQAKGRAECWVAGPERLPAPALSIHAETRAWKAAEALRRGAAHCAEAIVARLADPDAGFMGAGEGRPWVRLAPRDIAVLVRSRREADAVRQALQRRGVASVYLSDQNSVFASPEAADLLLWLRAVASPLDQRLARAALAGGTFGLPLAELARQVHDDAAWDASLALLRQLHGVWQRQGVLALVRQTLHGRGLPAQWLAQSTGERRLTNVLHLAELLQAASQKLDGGPALLRWLSDQIAEPEGGRDEQIVRLESEADLVQVVTVHKSKGLEYPLVFLPFAASVRRGGQGGDKDGDKGGDETDSEDQDDARVDREALREDIRLLYVALTRARHALWLGLVPPSATTAKADPQGVGATTVTRSALGWLLAGAEILADETWQIKAPDLPALLGQVWSPQSPELLQLSLAAEEGEALPCTLWQARSLPPLVLDAPAYQARFERDWAIGSFSAWVRDLDHHDPEDMAFSAVRPESLPAVRPELVEGPAWHHFPRGSEAGRFIHACLQGLAQTGLASVHKASFAEALQRRCELQNPQGQQGRGGWSAETLVAWLQTIVETPLPGLGAPLSAADRVLAEMEFWMPAPTASLQQLDGVCRRHGWPGLDRPALTQGVQNGLMMGFADLVIEHAGRYWVLDYKSNHLGDRDSAYTERALVHAVLQHRYDVQAALYLMALHRLLRQRLGAAYAPEHHLGGAMVLFVRGIQGPCAGTVLLPASAAWLADLEGLWAKEPV